MKRNITLRLDEELIRQAKVLAARESTSLNRLVVRELSRLVGRDQARERARRRALRAMEEGIPMGGGRVSRDELHER
ncbi:DUF6364 family protein [Gammaproteobacteria bacterium AB-CW1]|uniref:DUF6364 family protein n=1 Tax=Natronospira elongata TaxID=3110268 RepID=A0AAP6MN15_9GAMM|nr:DUF6364 family protein [Gammaproteobacteria bacterium AB-CW1]